MKPRKVSVLLTRNEQPCAPCTGGEHVKEVADGDGGERRTIEPADSVPPVRSTPQLSVWPAATVPFGPGPVQDIERVMGPGGAPAAAGGAANAKVVPKTRAKRIRSHPNEGPPTVSNHGNAKPPPRTLASACAGTIG